MRAYKGFDKDLKCRGFQYEVGGEYEEQSASLCSAGFHACENPLDTLRYYQPGDSRYCEVELEDNSQRNSDDTKVCGKKIKIGAEIGLSGIINAGMKFIFEKCESAIEDRASGTSGNAAASGASGNAAASGWSGNAAASGASGNAAASGTRGTATASGTSGRASANGDQCIAIAWGEDSYARGKIGTWIVVSEYDDDGDIINAAMAKVDGETIKPDTWYTLRGGKIVEVDE